jgi:hypothetical protein
MTIAKLYEKHKKGEVTKQSFLYEARKDANLPWINNLTSFEDAVKILKNKGVITETGLNAQGPIGSSQQRVQYNSYSSNAERNNLEEDLVNEGQFSWMTQDTGAQIGSNYRNRIEVTMYDNKGNSWLETHYEGYGVFGGKDYYELLAQMNGMPDGDRSDGIELAFPEDGKDEGTILYPALIQNPEEFNYKTHDFTQAPEDDPNQSWYQEEEYDDDDYGNDEEDYDEDDEDNQYNESLNEAHTLTTDQIIDRLNPYEFKKAVEYEMAKLKVLDNISYEKVKAKVAKKLAKDPLAYRYTQLANAKQVEKKDKALEMKPVKANNLVDKDNEVKKIKGFKEEKANTKSTKKENRKGMPKGVKEMKGSLKKPAGVKQIMKQETKETVINEMLEFFKKKDRLKEDNVGGAVPQERDDFFPGTECMTPDGKGVVIEKRGSIVTVKLEDGSERDYTLNVLDAAKEKADQDQIASDKESRDKMWSDWDKKGEKTFGGTAMYPMSSTQDLLKKLKGLVEKLKLKKESGTEITPAGGTPKYVSSANLANAERELKAAGITKYTKKVVG